MPKISIVTPCFNDALYLEKTIESVLGQGYHNLEYIIVDGGSTDGSVDIIRKYEHNLAWWCSEPDDGMYDAISKGFRHASGEVMGWINSDDFYHPGALFIIADIFREYKDVNWIQGIPNVVDHMGRVVYVSRQVIDNKYWFYQRKHIQSRRYIQQESTFWRKPLWEKAGGYLSSEFKYAGDFELWLRFFKHDRLINVPSLLGAFRLGTDEQASIHRYEEYVRETLYALSLHPLESQELRLMEKIQQFERRKTWLNGVLQSVCGGQVHRLDAKVKFKFDHQKQKFVLVGR